MINIGIGVAWAFRKLSRYVSDMILNFEARVYADGGVFEAEQCLENQLDALQGIGLLSPASLVITPNAVEEGKLFAIVPSDGSGDMSVVRATTATEVNSAGLIEDAPYNLLQRSEAFDNSIWLKINSSISANATNSPNGTLTADKLIENNLNDVHQLFYNGIATGSRIIGNFVFTVYAKKLDSNRNISISASSLGNGRYCIIDLQNNTILSNNTLTGTGGDVVSANVIENVSLNNDWIKISVLFVTSGTNYIPSIGVANNSNFSYLGNGTSGIYIWGAQLVTGSVAKEYFPTTDRLNVPRLDYTNSTCPSILVEPQRTNVITYSEDYANAAWSKLGTITVTANQTSSPNGTISADLVLGADATSSISQIYNGSSGVVYTNSFFIKNNNSIQTQLLIRNASTVVDAKLNWTGSVLSSITNTTGTTTFQDYSNGWYRVISTYTSVEAPQRPRILPTLSTNQSVYLWGSQLEAGANATSYIPTVAATVTRNADVISKTGISSLIGQTEGTIFVDFLQNTDGINSRGVVLLGQTNNYIEIGVDFSGRIVTRIIESGVDRGAYNPLGALTGFNKFALSYTSSGYKLFKNGDLVFTSTSTILPSTLNNIYVGYNFTNSSVLNGNIKSVLLYKTVLTDAQLELLTGSSFLTYDEMALALNYNIQ